ncbi:MAG: ABC transporter permease [Myxococcota bacterium]|nr:ABC transporter permease [Myxococcota bacterium]
MKPATAAQQDGAQASPELGSTLRSTRAFIEQLGLGVTGSIEGLGRFALLFVEMLIAGARPPYRLRQLFLAMDFVGFGSLFIVLLTGIFTGAVFAYQSAYAFRLFNAESLVGATVALAITRELGPVLTGLMVAGRVASAMATVLGTMRVTEQIDAMKTMAVDPVQFLIVPRVLASFLLMPVLCLLFDFIGILGSYFVGVVLLDIDFGPFDRRIRELLQIHDIVSGMVKAGVFGILVSFIGCYKGFYASGGAKGVGEATTSAVVTSSITILIVDYFLTVLMW